MSYPTIFDPIPWPEVGISIVQSFVIYWFILVGLRLVGRRVFGQLGPQDLILLFLISEAADIGLSHQEAGFWGTIASLITLLSIITLAERIRPLKRLLEPKPLSLFKAGQPDQAAMNKVMLELEDLDNVAYQYGQPDHTVFETMMMDSEGRIAGVLKAEHRPRASKI